MRALLLGVGAWTLLVTGIAAAGWAAVGREPPSVPLTTPAARAASVSDTTPYAADSLGQAVIGRDLFRSTRRPAAVAYDPGRPDVAAVLLQPRPVLSLSGIVWGAMPEAVIEGLPGATGPRVVRTGDVVAQLTVKGIGLASVVIVGMDTTWTLTVREPWR